MKTITIPRPVFNVAAAAQQKGKAGRFALNAIQIVRADGFATATAADGHIALRAKWADAGEPLEFLVEIADWRELTKLARDATVSLTPEFNMLNAVAETKTGRRTLDFPLGVGRFPSWQFLIEHVNKQPHNPAASQPVVNGYLMATLSRAVHYLTDGEHVTMSWSADSPLLLKASGNDLDVIGVLMPIEAKAQKAA